ncbi:MAG: hypothetical protein QXJ45_06135 [Thermoproteota archaeon]
MNRYFRGLPEAYVDPRHQVHYPPGLALPNVCIEKPAHRGHWLSLPSSRVESIVYCHSSSGVPY